MREIHILCHPLVGHHMSLLRDRDATAEQFRAQVRRLTYLLTIEATRDLRVESRDVHTPIAVAAGQHIRDRVAVVPILRAGMGMIDPLLELIPQAEVWHLGIYRDEQTLAPVEYYHKLPKDQPPDVAIVIDPMLATGGSASAALTALRQWGVQRCKLLSLIAAPAGIEHVHADHPATQIYVCGRDPTLNHRGFIVPGLGDAGDRIFNTP